MSSLLIVLAACNNSSTTNSGKTDSSAMDNGTTTTTTTSETRTTTVIVPEKTKKSFTTRYPKASKVTWSKYHNDAPIDWDMTGWPAIDTTDYVANFNDAGSDYWSWYNPNGDWIGTAATVPPAELPAPVNNSIKSNYADYEVTTVTEVIDPSRTAYEVQLGGKKGKTKILYDANGNIIKKKEKIDGVKTKEKPGKD
jgi:hypothetical protein